jgi:hypothetical protein
MFDIYRDSMFQPSMIKKLIALILALAPAPALNAYSGSSWNTVYSAVFTQPYPVLPHYEIVAHNFGASGDRDENRLRAAALRTLTVKDDLYAFPGGQKLLQANGICFAGDWSIDRETSYTGAFAPGTRFPLIARASVALGGTGYDDKRAFALAVKLFPAPDRETRVHTLNFFVMESLAGKRRQYFLESILDNAPDFGGLPALGEWRLALRVQNDLKAADRELSPAGPDLAFRPVDHLAYIPGVTEGIARGPKWLRLRIAADTPLNRMKDFRDELDLNAYPDHRLVWEVEVAATHARGKSRAEWRRIGTVILRESIASKPCDARLHFSHPILEHE